MSQPLDVNSRTFLDFGGNTEQSNLDERNSSRDEFRQFVESAPDAMVIINDHGQIALVNVQTERLFGYERDELLGQPVEILMPDRFRCRHREHLVDYFVNPSARSMGTDLKIYGQRKDGTEFPAEVSLSPIETAGGMLISSAIRDITDRKLMRAIDEARILAEAIVETVREPLLILNTELRVQTANRSFYQTFGSTHQETENRLVYELGNGQWDIPRLRHLLEQVLPEHTQFDDFEVQHTFEGIGQRTMLLNARALNLESDRPGLILLAIEDVTDRKLMRAINEARILAEAIVETVREPLLILDTELRVQTANRSFYETFQITRQETKDQLLYELGNHQWDIPQLRHLLEQVLPEQVLPHENQFDDFEVQHSFERIGTRTMLLNARKLDREGERPGLILLAIDDITERKRVDKELKGSAAKLQRYNRELERSNRELQDFAYVVSHDLRAPLVNIQGFSKELALSCETLPSVLADLQVPETKRRKLSALLEEDIPESLEFITTNATKMDGLLAGVLRLSRVGQAALTFGPLDMNQMLSEIVASRQFAVEQTGASMQVDSLPSCQGDELQINQVFSNLLDNALKYLDPNRPGVIRVCGQEEPDQVVYSIEDNGIGIAAQHQDSIYKVFHRLDPQSGTGEGLGLAIVRRILERHHGKIWVESEVNEGSKFYLSLPKGSCYVSSEMT